MTYVDGFVLIVPKKNVKAYRKLAKMTGKVWKKHGALEYFECIGEDLYPKMGGMKEATTFPKMTKLKNGETVWFSFIIYRSKAHRNSVNARVMKDPMMNEDTWKDKPMPFDMKRVAYAGFKALVEEQR